VILHILLLVALAKAIALIQPAVPPPTTIISNGSRTFYTPKIKNALPQRSSAFSFTTT
jgi:hypothetical protein